MKHIAPAIFILLLTACSAPSPQQQAPAASPTMTPARAHTPLKLPIISPPSPAMAADDEGLAEAERIWRELIIKCGDFFTLKKDAILDQYKGVEMQVITQSLTDADKLNGIEWKGETRLLPTARRSYDFQARVWSNWQDYPTNSSLFVIQFEKVRGAWRNDQQNKPIFGPLLGFKPVACADVP